MLVSSPVSPVINWNDSVSTGQQMQEVERNLTLDCLIERLKPLISDKKTDNIFCDIHRIEAFVESVLKYTVDVKSSKFHYLYFPQQSSSSDASEFNWNKLIKNSPYPISKSWNFLTTVHTDINGICRLKWNNEEVTKHSRLLYKLFSTDSKNINRKYGLLLAFFIRLMYTARGFEFVNTHLDELADEYQNYILEEESYRNVKTFKLVLNVNFLQRLDLLQYFQISSLSASSVLLQQEKSNYMLSNQIPEKLPRKTYSKSKYLILNREENLEKVVDNIREKTFATTNPLDLSLNLAEKGHDESGSPSNIPFMSSSIGLSTPEKIPQDTSNVIDLPSAGAPIISSVPLLTDPEPNRPNNMMMIEDLEKESSQVLTQVTEIIPDPSRDTRSICLVQREYSELLAKNEKKLTEKRKFFEIKQNQFIKLKEELERDKVEIQMLTRENDSLRKINAFVAEEIKAIENIESFIPNKVRRIDSAEDSRMEQNKDSDNQDGDSHSSEKQ